MAQFYNCFLPFKKMNKIMRRLLPFTCLLFFSSLTAGAQDPGINTWDIELSTGMSFPLGNNTNGKLQEAGLANYGYNAKMQGTYFFNDYIGLATTGSYSQINVKTFEVSDPRITKGQWKFYALTTGPVMRLFQPGRFAIDFHIGAGIAMVDFPVMKLYLHQGTVYTNETWCTTFAAQIGTSFRYYISPSFFICSNVDLKSVRPSVKLNLQGMDDAVQVSQAIDWMNVNLGLGINF